MRMKEDHLKNGQLKAAYNLQMSSSNQFITHYSIHPNPGDTLTLKPHLEGIKKYYHLSPDQLTADAGYGSEENYTFFEDQNIEGFVKYNYFDQESKPSFEKKRPFHPNSLHYMTQEDAYICPMGQKMNFIGQTIRKTSSGFEQRISKYQAQNCQGCPLRPKCHKSQHNRIIQINHTLNSLKKKARDKLTSEQGIQKRKNRVQEIEPVFGILKQNHGFRRLTLRGKGKVEVEVGLHALAHNIRKCAAILNNKPPQEPLFPFVNQVATKQIDRTDNFSKLG